MRDHDYATGFVFENPRPTGEPPLRDHAKRLKYRKTRYERLKKNPEWWAKRQAQTRRYYVEHKEEILKRARTPEALVKHKAAWKRHHEKTYFIKVSHNGHPYWYKGGKRLHRLIYERYVGPIPEGYDVHHIDGNSLRNCLSNLLFIEHGEHTRLHKLGEI